MKIITEKQKSQLNTRHRGKISPVVNALKSLDIGQLGFLTYEEIKEWGYKSPIATVVHGSTGNSRGVLAGRKFSVGQYEEGVVVKRLK